MAKSVRSKWKRKCRAVKRVRYGQKELERLKKTLGITNDDKDTEMISVEDIANVVSKKEMTVEQESKTETDKGRIFNPKTMRDQYGNYPVWMNKRKIRKSKKIEKNKKSKKKH